jgi:hypothetical protein
MLATIKYRIVCLPVREIKTRRSWNTVTYCSVDVWLVGRFPTLKEHGLRVSENRVPRRIFGPKRDEVTRGWKKFHRPVELHVWNDLHQTGFNRVIKSRWIRWMRHATRTGEMQNAHRFLIWKPEEKKPLGGSKRRRNDNIKIYRQHHVRRTYQQNDRFTGD